MKKHKIVTQKTTRFFTSEVKESEVESIWFVLHGYGQLPEFFLRKFQPLFNSKTLFVAPEGLHRYYLNGFSGRVGASWMTKEEREDDIKDYIYLLNEVEKEVKDLHKKELKINLLGFSQGAATACRWCFSDPSKFNQLVLHSGVFPPDLDLSFYKTNNALKVSILIGSEDEFIKQENVTEHMKWMQKLDLKAEIIHFDGKHDIHIPTLKHFINV